MDRKQKIKVLQAINEGLLQPQDLLPPQKFMFFQADFGRSEDFGMNGKIYTPDELATFKATLEERNKRRVAFGLEEDKVFMFNWTDFFNKLNNKP